MLESRVVPEINFRRNSQNSIFLPNGSLGGFAELSASVLAFLLDVNCAVTQPSSGSRVVLRRLGRAKW